MSKKTVKRVQRVFRGIGVLGWASFTLGCAFYMGRLCPVSHVAWWAALGCVGMFLAVAFGGVLGGLLGTNGEGKHK